MKILRTIFPFETFFYFPTLYFFCVLITPNEKIINKIYKKLDGHYTCNCKAQLAIFFLFHKFFHIFKYYKLDFIIMNNRLDFYKTKSKFNVT